MSYQPPPDGFRTFLIVWGTQSVSVFGSALTFFALNIWLTQSLYPLPEQKPQLAMALSAVSLAFAIPVVFGAPLAGAWADRHDRKRTMMAMDFGNGCLSLLLAALVISHALELWLLVVLLVVASLLGAFHSSAFDTSYAMLVPKQNLPRANGMMQTMWSLSGIISPAIAATIIAVPALARQGAIAGSVGTALGRLADGTPLAMAADGMTFFLAAATLLFLKVPSPRRTDLLRTDETGRVYKKSMLADVKEGAMYIWRRKPLLWLLGTFTMANFCSSPLGVFLPLILKFNLAGDWSARGFVYETALALLSSIQSMGGVVGGIFISSWGGLKRRRVYGVVIPILLSGVGGIVFGLSPLLYLTAAAAFLISALVPIMNAHSQSIWQTQTPHELQGRVFSVRRLIAQCSWPLSTALAGWAGGYFNPGAVMAVLGGLLAAFCVGQLFYPYLLQVEDKVMLDELAAAAEKA